MILLQKVELLSTFYNSLSQPATSWFVAKQVCMCEGDTHLMTYRFVLE